MVRAAILGLGWWGGTLVDAVKGSPHITFTGAFTRSGSQSNRDFCASHGLKLYPSLDELLADPQIDAVVLATPPTAHAIQIAKAAAARKHVFCEKPLVMTKSEADAAVAAVTSAGVSLGLGFNRRFHPSWRDLKARIARGDLGVILHAECTMSGPNGLSMSTEAWRANRTDAPLGGLMPMGIHAVDGFIDLFGEIDSVFCQSFRRVVPNDNDDTTNVLLRMRAGMSAYLGTMMATAGTFRFQVYGSQATALLSGTVHIAGQSSHQRRAGLFGTYLLQPVKGDAEELAVDVFDVNRAELEAFAIAASGGAPYPISLHEMVHGVAATEAIIRSAGSGQVEFVER